MHPSATVAPPTTLRTTAADRNAPPQPLTKIVSVFEPGRGPFAVANHKPTEFGQVVKAQEAEGGLVITLRS